MRTACTWIIATAAMLLSACSDATSGGLPAPKPFTDFDELVIEQSACLFNCPVFELAIFSDGRVRHSGPSFEQTGGPLESRIDGRGLALIAKALGDARIDEMRGSYQEQADGCESRLSDMSTVSVRVNRGQGAHSKRVILDAGCLGPTVPSGRLGALFKAIDRVTGTEALLAQRMRARRAEGGAVAPAH